MQPEQRNNRGNVIIPDSPRVKEGNLNPELYADPSKAKNVPTKDCCLEDGITPRYGKDGLTIDWSPATPHVTPVR
jgi:hypothetical protein